ncbi:MAG: hypothetical protein ACLQBD_03930 [Syntrophobacteraceae bacterium]
MTGGSSTLADRIAGELDEVQRVTRNIQKDWQNFLRTADDGYLKATAFDLHSFYTGLERVFKLIAEILDGRLPVGEGWHKLLINQMALEIQGVRPAVISEATLELLDEYLRFRHLVRNVYSFNLLPEKVQSLVERLPTALDQVTQDVSAFVNLFLAQTTNPFD